MIIKDYKHKKKYRKSMSELSEKNFGLNFEKLYNEGYWADEFIAYSIVENEKVISNVCFHLFELEKNKKKYKVLQIGTVATYEKHRNKGLSKQLMNEVIKDYEDKVDAMYLFANESVINFYPKFGFKPVNQMKFNLSNLDELEVEKNNSVKLNIAKDIKILDRCITNRINNSKSDFLTGDDYIKMFYCLYGFTESIYYHKKEDAVIILEKEESTLIVYDIYVKKEEDIKKILGQHLEGIDNISFRFDVKLRNLVTSLDENAKLFVRTNNKLLLEPWSYPETSMT